MARSKGRTFYMNAMSTNKLSDTYHQLYKKGVMYILYMFWNVCNISCMYIAIISFLLSVQKRIKFNLWIWSSNMKSKGVIFSPSNIIRKERNDAVAKNTKYWNFINDNFFKNCNMTQKLIQSNSFASNNTTYHE